MKQIWFVLSIKNMFVAASLQIHGKPINQLVEESVENRVVFSKRPLALCMLSQLADTPVAWRLLNTKTHLLKTEQWYPKTLHFSLIMKLGSSVSLSRIFRMHCKIVSLSYTSVYRNVLFSASTKPTHRIQYLSLSI